MKTRPGVPVPVSDSPEAKPVVAKVRHEYRVDPGLLDAWVIGLEKKLFVNNELAARELGVSQVVNKFGIPEMKQKIKASFPRGLVVFEEETDAE